MEAQFEKLTKTFDKIKSIKKIPEKSLNDLKFKERVEDLIKLLKDKPKLQ